MRTLLLAAASSLAGCGFTCTLQYAPSGVEVMVDSAEDWAPGTYELELSGYNNFAMCLFTIPWEGDDPACTGNAWVQFDPTGMRLVAFHAESFAPKNFRLELLQDGELWLEESFEPDYSVDQPNGPGCGQRRRATIDLLL